MPTRVRQLFLLAAFIAIPGTLFALLGALLVKLIRGRRAKRRLARRVVVLSQPTALGLVGFGRQATA